MPGRGRGPCDIRRRRRGSRSSNRTRVASASNSTRRPCDRHRALDALARAAPTTAGRRERRERQALGQPPLQAPVVRIVLADRGSAGSARSAARSRGRGGRGSIGAPTSRSAAIAPRIVLMSGRSPNASTGVGTSTSSQPSPAVPRRIDTSAGQAGDPAPERPVAAILEPLEIAAHDLGAPRRIAGQRRRSRSSPSRRGAIRIMALWAVQPPRVEARG